MPETGSVRASLAWNYGAHLLVFAVTFGGLVVISRLLSPRELGIFGVGMAISGVLGTISYFGVANYLIRDEALSEDTRAACFTVNALMSLAVAAVLLLLGTMGAGLFSDSAVPEVLCLMAAVPVLGIVEMVPATLLTRAMRFGPVSLVQLGKAMVNAGVMVLLAFRGWSYLSPAFGAIAGALYGAAAFAIAGRGLATYRFSLANWRKIAAFAAHMVTAGGVPIITARLSELIVAQWLGLAALGIYTRASQLAAMVWDGAYGLSTKVIYVHMAAELRKSGSLRETFLRATRLLTAVMWPAMSGIAVLAGPIVHHLYGPQWDAAAWPLALLMAAQCVLLGYAMMWELCVLRDRTAWQARMESTRAIAGLIAFALGALVSLPVAAAGRIVDALVGYAIYRPKMPELAGAGRDETRAAYAGNLALAAVAVAPAAAVMAWHSWSFSAPLWQLGLSVIAGGLAWLAALALARHLLFEELRLLLAPARAAG